MSDNINIIDTEQIYKSITRDDDDFDKENTNRILSLTKQNSTPKKRVLTESLYDSDSDDDRKIQPTTKKYKDSSITTFFGTIKKHNNNNVITPSTDTTDVSPNDYNYDDSKPPAEQFDHHVELQNPMDTVWHEGQILSTLSLKSSSHHAFWYKS